MPNVKEIAWLAGLIEGEGYIGYINGTNCIKPSIKIEMTDKDIIEKVAGLFKRPIYSHSKEKYGCKTTYSVAIYGTPAIEWLFTIYSFLGNRRRMKTLETINLWKQRKEKHSIDTYQCGHLKTSDNFTYAGKYKICKKCSYERNKSWRLRNA